MASPAETEAEVSRAGAVEASLEEAAARVASLEEAAAEDSPAAAVIPEDSPAAGLLREQGIPFAVIGPGDEGTLTVDNDNLGACRALTARVLQAGQGKRPALLGGEIGHRVTQSRLTGFRLGCQDCGVTPDERLLFLDGEAGDMDEWLDRLLPPGYHK